MRISDWSSDVCSSDLDPKMDAGDRSELAERWRAEARDYQYNGDKIYAMALSRSQERSSPIERGILAVRSAIRDSRDRLIDYLVRHGRLAEHRVGKECVGTCKSWWWRCNVNKNKNILKTK